MAKKETAPAKFTIGDLLALLSDYTPEEVRDAIAANKPGKTSKPAKGGKGKKSSDEEEEEEEEEEEDEDPKPSKGKGKGKDGKGKGKKADVPDAKTEKKLRKQISDLIKKFGDLDDEDADEEVEDLLADFDVEEVKKLKPEQLVEFAAKLEEIFEEFDE